MNFSPSEFFDLSRFAHASVFDSVENVWEVLPLIQEYLEYSVTESDIQSDVSRAAHIGERVIIGKHVIIEPGVVIHGPAIIGDGCHLRSGAYIRENVIVGSNCTIGHATEAKNSILFDDVVAPHFNYLGDSILGNKTHLGSSVILSNLKTPPSPISIVTLEKTHYTGLFKFGAIIGDSTEIGANAVLNPGTVVGREAVIYPLALVRGVVNHRAILKVRQQQEIVIRK